MKKNGQHIDAVITWVDGNDQQHYEKRLKVVSENQEIKEKALPTGKDHTRFVDNGELKYCLQSIRKFAPWIRTIHLVTDNQRPDFLTESFQKENGIELVNHEDIFASFEWALPTFNSRTIETALWRIPDLANHFIYFNDDFILTSSVKPEHFFPDGKVLLRGRWNSIKNYGSIRLKINEIISILSKKVLGITRSMHLLQQIKSAQLAGFEKKYYRTPHVPHPIIKSSLSEFFRVNQESFEANIQYKFRNMEQFSAVFLAHHLEIVKGNVVLKKPYDFLMLNGELDISITLKPKLKKIKNRDVKFICLQGFEKYSRLNQKNIIEVLEDILKSE
ncbi:MAG: Stealth CR1 domain-containing protein [Balneolaceae bacterium]|nr:Stealth CR1 domain-containing protein [Balneolaceae bacterium]